MENTAKTPKRKGPVPGPKTDSHSVMLEPETADWAKATEEGLSRMLRRLLRAEYERVKKLSSNT